MPPKDSESHKEREVDLNGEMTALLLHPSPHSTNRPSLTNLMEYGSAFAPYGETAEEDDELLIQMQNQQIVADEEGSFGDDAWTSSRRRSKAKIRLVCLVASSLSLLVAAAVSCYGNNQNKKARQPSSNNIHQQHGFISRAIQPFSQKDPVADLNVKSYQRPDFSCPNRDLFVPTAGHKRPLPTNAWYQNLLLARHEPTEAQRVYPVPYVVDVVGPIPGLRVHYPTLVATATVVQVTQVLEHGLTLGAVSRRSILEPATSILSKKYRIVKMTPLGITLEWTDPTQMESEMDVDLPPPLTYSASIVRGMPYATMQYNSNQQNQGRKRDPHNELLPTIASESHIRAPPILDGGLELNCHNEPEPKWVQREIELVFSESDHTWLVFLSRSVRVQCILPPPNEHPPEFVPGLAQPSPGIVFALQFLDNDDSSKESDLVVRVALANDCTRGDNPITCNGPTAPLKNATAYANLLRQHADWYPGPDTDVTFDFGNDTNRTGGGPSLVKFNWNVQNMRQADNGTNVASQSGAEKDVAEDSNGQKMLVEKMDLGGGAKLLMYALPHHQDLIQESVGASASGEKSAPSFPTHSSDDPEEARFCTTSLLGPACLVQGSTWNLNEDLNWETSFRAPRPPQSDALPALVKAYKEDLTFELPLYFQRGAGDTYFSGKMLAKLARILTIGEELVDICSNPDEVARPEECTGLEIPSTDDSMFLDALARLRGNVEVWINGTADTPFVYDAEWGGLVSCGCNFDDKVGSCRNSFPDCPAFYDPGLNFGNAYYNDHHFHYGYHIYAAAAVAHFDPQWGRENFDRVLLLVRDIANPSQDDAFFPTYRSKDWYQGSSWASGVADAPLNGRNQESSSEAISAYEGVALFGKEMVSAWKDYDDANANVALQIQKYGEVMMASEVRSADRYWHVFDARLRHQYPVEYTPRVVGIMWNTMSQFQTWFGGEAYLAYGIQLLPLTPAAEKRDTVEWTRELYAPFADSCDAHYEDCRDYGWSILVFAILATVGHANEAISKTLDLPTVAFTSAGGNGHSLTNTLWYLSTRPHIDDALIIDPNSGNGSVDAASLEKEMHNPGESIVNKGVNGQASDSGPARSVDPNFNCSCTKTCNGEALERFASGHSCRDRIIWLMTQRDESEWDACHQVGLEFPVECGACNPQQCSLEDDSIRHSSDRCPPCSKGVCQGKLNRCPISSAPFLCTQGASVGGCSASPWTKEPGVCDGCCELSVGCED